MNAITTFILLSLLRCLSLLPLRLLHGMGRQLGRLMWYLPLEARRVTEENLSICFPDLPATERTALAKQHIQHLGMMALELPFVWLRPSAKVFGKVLEIRGEEIFDRLRAEGKGVILLAPHIGNWEVMGNYLGRFGTTMMYQPPENPAMDKLIYNARTRDGVALVPTSVVGVKGLLKALKRGEVVGVLPDQVPSRGTGGEFAPFFNVPALTATLCFNLLQRTGARAVVIYVERLAGKGFRIVFEQVSPDIYSQDEVTSLSALNQSVEDCAHTLPEQYQWEYKRFRKQPDGVKRYYRKR